jgi:hypothetical protein
LPLAGFGPAIPTIKKPKTYVIDRTVTGIDHQPLLVTKSWRIRWADRVARIGKKRKAYRVLVTKTEGRKTILKE